MVFYLLATGYLAVSYWSISQGKPALSAADPVTSGILLSIYCVFLLAGVLKAHTLYRVLMGISVVGFGYGGVIYNILNYLQNGLEGYSSFTAWIIAIAINTYRLIFNFLAAIGKYEK